MRMSKLMLPAVTVAGALALAGCGGGGGGTTPTVDNCATEALPFEGGDGNCYASETAYDTLVANRKAADEAIKAADDAADGLEEGADADAVGGVADLIDDAETAIEKLPAGEQADKMAELATARSIVALFEDVLRLTGDLEEKEGELADATNEAGATGTVFRQSRVAIAALDAASNLLADATGASIRLAVNSTNSLDPTENVNGSSQKVYENVMTALNARAAIAAERDKAIAAVTALEGIDTDDLSDSAKNLVTEAIALAQQRRNRIIAILTPRPGTPDALKSAEARVRGRTAPGTEPEKVARARAKAVADAMETAIAGADPAITRMSTNSAVKSAGEGGRTFRLINGGSGSLTVNDLDDDFFSGATATAYTGTAIPRNTSVPVNYNGIPGRLSCTTADTAISDCTFSNGEVTAGDVVFLPDNPSDIYHAPTPNARYEAVMNAASYGYWLDSDGDIVRHARSLTDDPGDLLWTADTSPAAGDKPVVATYSGEAGGYSQRETGTGSDKVRHSGEFTAKVDLKATFGAEANATNTFVDGSISGFAAADPSKGSDHVNGSWAVDLRRIGFDASSGSEGTVPDNVNTTDGGTGFPRIGRIDPDQYRAGEVGATNGGWTAVPYGKPNSDPTKRTHPTGFVGMFDAGIWRERG